MIQTLLQPHAAYWFTELLELRRRSTPHEPIDARTFTQCGFYLVDSAVKESHIQRTLAQYILSEPFLKAFRTTTVVSRAILTDEHRRQWATPHPPFGLEIPIVLQTTPRNTAPRVPVAEIPPPVESLYLPTITPVFAELDPVPTWTGALDVTCGFATFKVPYTVAWTPETPAAPASAQITWNPAPVSVSKKDITLTLTVSGAMTTTFRLPDLQPLDSVGDVRMLVTGHRGSETPGELLNVHSRFHWLLVPLGYTAENVVTKPWSTIAMPAPPA